MTWIVNTTLMQGDFKLLDDTDYTLARSILGKDFISAAQIAEAHGLTYTKEQLIELGKKLPDQATLEVIRDTGMVLMAGPPAAMTICDITYLYRSCYDSKDICDVLYKICDQYKIDALIWIALRKDPVDDSFFKSWSEQEVLVKDPLYIPNDAEVVWCLAIYKEINDVYLMQHVSVRTSSLDSGIYDPEGHHIFVGPFSTDGLRVSSLINLLPCDDECNGSLGLSAARKF